VFDRFTPSLHTPHFSFICLLLRKKFSFFYCSRHLFSHSTPPPPPFPHVCFNIKSTFRNGPSYGVATINRLLKLSFVEYRLFYRALLQKRPVILRGLLMVATPSWADLPPPPVLLPAFSSDQINIRSKSNFDCLVCVWVILIESHSNTGLH